MRLFAVFSLGAGSDVSLIHKSQEVIFMFRALRFFFQYGWKYDRLYIIEKILFQLTNSFVPLVLTILPKYIIDELMGLQRPEHLFAYIAVLTGLVFFANAVSAFLEKDSFSHRLNVDAAFGQALHKTQAEADLAVLEDPEYLDLKQKAEKFITCDWHGFGYLLDCALDIGGQLLTLTSIAVIVSMMSGTFILLFAATTALSSLAEFHAKQKANALYDRVISAQRGWTYYGNLFGDFRFGKEIRLNRIAKWLLDREKEYLQEAIGLMRKQNNYAILSGIVAAACSFVQQAASYAFVCVRVLRGSIGIGDFTMYTAAITAFALALRKVIGNVIETQNYDRYFQDVERYLHLPKTIREGRNLPLPEGPYRIEFRDVGFRYPGQDTWALRHLNLVLEPGKKLSIVGENGAGKTTFVKLLIRLYDVSEGVILLNGMDIRELEPDAYMAIFGTAFQDFKLFSFSVKDNIALGKPCSDDQAEQLLKTAGLSQRISTLEEGIHTFVNREFDEHGFEPSGGEAQKLALARALFRNTPIIILDEPTAALDPLAEAEMYRNFTDLTGNRAVILISHRLGITQLVDRILVFDDGQIVEDGSHEELLKKQGLYARMYQAQAQWYQ